MQTVSHSKQLEIIILTYFVNSSFFLISIRRRADDKFAKCGRSQWEFIIKYSINVIIYLRRIKMNRRNIGCISDRTKCKLFVAIFSPRVTTFLRINITFLAVSSYSSLTWLHKNWLEIWSCLLHIYQNIVYMNYTHLLLNLKDKKVFLLSCNTWHVKHKKYKSKFIDTFVPKLLQLRWGYIYTYTYVQLVLEDYKKSQY
jgi:hypothetical protein